MSVQALTEHGLNRVCRLVTWTVLITTTVNGATVAPWRMWPGEGWEPKPVDQSGRRFGSGPDRLRGVVRALLTSAKGTRLRA